MPAEGNNVKRLGPAFISLLLSTACSWTSRQGGKPVAVAITVQFETSSEADGSAAPSSPLSATPEVSPDVGGTETAAPVVTPLPTGATTESISGATGETRQVADSATLLSLSEQEKQFYAVSTLPPNKLLTDPLTIFKYKRAHRWFAYKVTRGSEVIKEGAIELKDPNVMSLNPVELDAFQGDVLRVSMSLLQFDFIDAAHKEKFCTSGSPALVRSWFGTTDYTVNADGLISMRMPEPHLTTAHMAAVGFTSSELSRIYTPRSAHILSDQVTGLTFDMTACPISEMQIAGSLSPPDVRHIKMLTFSSPLKAHRLGILSGTGRSFPEFQASQMDDSFSDIRAAHLLGISATLRSSTAADGSVKMSRISPADMLGNEWVFVSADGIPEKSELSLMFPKADFWVGPNSGPFAIAGTCAVGDFGVSLSQNTKSSAKFLIEDSESAEVKCAANGTFFARGKFPQPDGTTGPSIILPGTYDFSVVQETNPQTTVPLPGKVGYDSQGPILYNSTANATIDGSTVLIRVPVNEPHSGIKSLDISKIKFSPTFNCKYDVALKPVDQPSQGETHLVLVSVYDCEITSVLNNELFFDSGALTDHVGNTSPQFNLLLN
ncbi:MAG: hypothetical protein RLZZ488_654 [Pseudomonadota bacterium]